MWRRERLVASWWIGAHSIFGASERLPRLGEDRESIAHSSAQRCLCLLSDTRVMILSSFLLPASKAKAKAIDKGLDDLFRASASVSLPGGLTSLAERMRIQAPPPYPSGSIATSSSDVAALNLEKKRKATEEAERIRQLGYDREREKAEEEERARLAAEQAAAKQAKSPVTKSTPVTSPTIATMHSAPISPATRS